MPATLRAVTVNARLRAVTALAAYGAGLPEEHAEAVASLIAYLVPGAEALSLRGLEVEAAQFYHAGIFDPQDRFQQGLAAEAVEALEAVIGKDADAWGEG